VIGVRGDYLQWWCGGHHGRLHPRDNHRAAEVGQMLWAENGKSINARYLDDDEHKLVYGTHVPARCDMDQIQIIKACHCYEYQSCEHGGWEKSEAKVFIDAIIQSITQCLPRYDDAEWGPPKSMCPYPTKVTQAP
jgi:hypothetical protein